VGTLAWLRCRVNRPKLAPRRLAAALFLAAGSVTVLALAADDPRKQTESILASLAKKPQAERVASDAIGKANAALRRAEHLRALGDQQHGAMLEQTALEWASAAELLDKTARSEEELRALQTKTTELETKVFRAQALVEQTVARRARAEEALRKLDEKGAKP
jgi:hypothetical protein